MCKKMIFENGLLITEKALAAGVSKAELYEYIKENNLERVAHGVYAKEDDLVDASYIVHLRCPKAVFSHDEAFYYHDLVDLEPMQTTVTIYTGYNTSRLVESGAKVYTVKKELLNLGLIEITDNFGNKLPMYNLERTICDLVRSRSSIEVQDFHTALKRYVTKQEKDLNRLISYAKLFRIEKKIRQYMEVLL